MNRSFPCIWLCDIETSIQWYADFLGFKCTYKSALKKPEFALIENKEVKLYLIQSENMERYASNTYIIETASIEQDFKKMEKAGVIIIQSIEEGVFGGKEFVIKDYEDNKIIYHQSA